MAQEDVIDSPAPWVREHIERYEADPETGADWQGLPTLLLTTRGRKSGKLRRTALLYQQDGDNYVVVGSHGGSPDHPLWYLNLLADPEVDLQVGTTLRHGRARPATPEEKPRLWDQMVAIFPAYAQFQAQITRELPVVIIEPAGNR